MHRSSDNCKNLWDGDILPADVLPSVPSSSVYQSVDIWKIDAREYMARCSDRIRIFEDNCYERADIPGPFGTFFVKRHCLEWEV